MTELSITRFFNGGEAVRLSSVQLPRKLEVLRLVRGEVACRGMAGRWPDTLHTLETDCNHPLLEGDLPPSLTRLKLTGWNQADMNSLILPPKLRAIKFGALEHAFTGIRWPDTLEELTMANGWMIVPTAETLPLPPNLRVLRFRPQSWFDQSLAALTLPDSLDEFDLSCERFGYPLNDVRFPPRLRVLKLPSTFRHKAVDLPLAGSLPASLREVHVNKATERLLATWAPLLPTHCAILGGQG